MDSELKSAFTTGYERMVAWSDLLDEINVYPVADADTGRNLRISLSPLKTLEITDITHRLLHSAIGNSGNIAGAFFAKFTQVDTPLALSQAAYLGAASARQSLLIPKPGTMLSVFDSLATVLGNAQDQITAETAPVILEKLRNTVIQTAEMLPELKTAGVIDSGALAMFLFFEGFIWRLTGRVDTFISPTDQFSGKLTVLADHFSPQQPKTYCINTLIQPSVGYEEISRKMAEIGDQVVSRLNGKEMKIHFHSSDADAACKELTGVGNVIDWNPHKIEIEDPITSHVKEKKTGIQIVTDAAGSITREAARSLGISLLESYILIDDKPVPETSIPSKTLYDAMRRGNKVTTAQASIFERHQHYESLLNRNHKIIYLCTGSAFTGNFEVALNWVSHRKVGHRMAVIDTAAAAGRLGLASRNIAEFAASQKEMIQVIAYAETIFPLCQEIAFIDQLKYLATGGRISKAKGFFGGLFNVKPIIHQSCSGIQKIGAVKNQKEQLVFALDYLKKNIPSENPSQLLVQFTDNEDWLKEEVKPRIETFFPKAEILVEPMSFTSGVHMGPGTWAIGYLVLPTVQSERH